ncbi:hypothetical protein, partial [Nonomuraea rubra]|uniref:hypothetical protein n=1 Tax=Nonomuraea rubra TaxID=46180 RepID=UPI0031E6FE7C
SRSRSTSRSHRHMKIRNLQQSLSVLQSLPGGGVDKTAKATPAELVSVGESYPRQGLRAAQGQRPAEPADRPRSATTPACAPATRCTSAASPAW